MPPSVNNYYATIKIGGRLRRIKSRDANAYEAAMRRWAFTFLDSIKRAKEFLKGLTPGMVLALHVDFFFPREKIFTKKNTPKRNDTSNRIKALHDQICMILGIDDCYIFDGSFTKRVGLEGCSLRLEFVTVL